MTISVECNNCGRGIEVEISVRQGPCLLINDVSTCRAWSLTADALATHTCGHTRAVERETEGARWR